MDKWKQAEKFQELKIYLNFKELIVLGYFFSKEHGHPQNSFFHFLTMYQGWRDPEHRAFYSDEGKNKLNDTAKP